MVRPSWRPALSACAPQAPQHHRQQWMMGHLLPRRATPSGRLTLLPLCRRVPVLWRLPVPGPPVQHLPAARDQGGALEAPSCTAHTVHVDIGADRPVLCIVPVTLHQLTFQPAWTAVQGVPIEEAANVVRAHRFWRRVGPCGSCRVCMHASNGSPAPLLIEAAAVAGLTSLA